MEPPGRGPFDRSTSSRARLGDLLRADGRVRRRAGIRIGAAVRLWRPVWSCWCDQSAEFSRQSRLRVTAVSNRVLLHGSRCVPHRSNVSDRCVRELFAWPAWHCRGVFSRRSAERLQSVSTLWVWRYRIQQRRYDEPDDDWPTTTGLARPVRPVQDSAGRGCALGSAPEFRHAGHDVCLYNAPPLPLFSRHSFLRADLTASAKATARLAEAPSARRRKVGTTYVSVVLRGRPQGRHHDCGRAARLAYCCDWR